MFFGIAFWRSVLAIGSIQDTDEDPTGVISTKQLSDAEWGMDKHSAKLG